MADPKHIQVYDTTLRDGCQSEDVSLTVEDKVTIAQRLDDLGFDYIEGGWPGSNDRDAAFFKEIKKIKIRHAKIAAFGSTRRSGVRAAAHRNLQLILHTGAHPEGIAFASLTIFPPAKSSGCTGQQSLSAQTSRRSNPSNICSMALIAFSILPPCRACLYQSRIRS